MTSTLFTQAFDQEPKGSKLVLPDPASTNGTYFSELAAALASVESLTVVGCLS
jgi:hypothetical protein